MAESLLTIVFRGLMVFHKQGDGANSNMEVGLHSQPAGTGHFLRINTIRNGIVAEIKSLHDEISTTNRIWNLVIDAAVGQGIKLSPHTTTGFDRRDDANNQDDDFAWTMNLEDPSFFGPLGNKIDTSNLKPVIRIPSGRLYSRIKTRRVIRNKDGAMIDPDFGRLCGAVGCDIRLTGPSAQLVPEGSREALFVFTPERDTIYEVAFLPPDFPVPSHPIDHFHHFYDHLLDSSLPKFSFEPILTLTLAPHPALCGEVFLAVRPNPL